MRSRLLVAIALIALAACREPSPEKRTFELRYLSPADAQQLLSPLRLPDVEIAMRGNTISVSGSQANLERVAQIIAEHDVAPPNVRLTFQIIRADGSRAPDPAIAAVEAQLRQLFRFAGYQLVATGLATGTAGGPVQLRLEGPEGPYEIRGELERVEVVGDSGVVRLSVQLSASGRGNILMTRVSVGIGQMVVLGGQASGDRGAIILAVKPDVVR